MISIISHGQSHYFNDFDINEHHLVCTAEGCRFSSNVDLSSYYGDRIEIQFLESLEPVKTYFNENHGKNRFIALLSPECPRCVEGALAIKEGILDEYPDKDLVIIVVWVDMYSGDDYASAKRTGRILSDSRVKHFYDSDLEVGTAFAKAFGASRFEARDYPAWDIYMFYSKEIKWEEDIPLPNDYTHQLGRRYTHWADYKHFNAGMDLYEELIDLAERY